MPKTIVSNAVHKFKDRCKDVPNPKKKIQGYYCAVPCCGRIDGTISSFMIPKEPEVRWQWLNFLQSCGKEVIVEKSTSYRICERHFEENRIHVGCGRKRLMYRSVPKLDLKTMVSFLNFYSIIIISIVLIFQRMIVVPEDETSMSACNIDESLMSALEPKVEVKEEPPDDYNDHQPTATVLQTYIKQEPLGIQEEPMKIKIEPLEIKIDSFTLSEQNPALKQLNELSEMQQNNLRHKRTNRRTVIMTRPLKTSSSNEPSFLKDQKHILCFICRDKFTSILTFDMHLKLMHKNDKKS
jgi:THAP domain